MERERKPRLRRYPVTITLRPAAYRRLEQLSERLRCPRAKVIDMALQVFKDCCDSQYNSILRDVLSQDLLGRIQRGEIEPTDEMLEILERAGAFGRDEVERVN